MIIGRMPAKAPDRTVAPRSTADLDADLAGTISALQARASRGGYAVEQVADGYLIARWNFTITVPSIDDLLTFLDRAGA